MSLTKKIAFNTATQISGKIISTVLGLFSLALITRYLGLSGFGEYITIVNFLTFFAVISDLGLTLVTVQMISRRGVDEKKIINNLFGLRLVSALTVLALAPLSVIFFPYSAAIKFGVIVALFSFLFPALNQIIIGLFQKRLSMDRDAIAEVISRLILVIGIISTEKLQFGLNGILLSLVASSAVNFLCHYLLACEYIVIKLEFDWLIWKEILSRSWPLTITIVLNLIYLRADIIILSLFRSTEEVGLYGAAYKIIDVLTTIPFMFAGLILPILTTAWSDNNQPYFKKILQRSFDFMAILAIPLIVGAQFLGQPIMRFVAGRDFAAAGPILQVLIFAVAAIFLGTMFSHAVIALDKQKKMIGFYIFTSLSALAAYLVLIPRFSYFGAAGVTIYSEVLIAIFSAVCVFKYSRCRLNLKITARAILSSLGMGLFIYLTAFYQATLGGLILVMIGASFIYFLLLYCLNGIRKSDLDAMFRRPGETSGPTYSGPNF
jgi:O-antigen/teichoic acid export membrane protein